jgi:hypothetical protein
LLSPPISPAGANNEGDAGAGAAVEVEIITITLGAKGLVQLETCPVFMPLLLMQDVSQAYMFEQL